MMVGEVRLFFLVKMFRRLDDESWKWEENSFYFIL